MYYKFIVYIYIIHSCLFLTIFILLKYLYCLCINSFIVSNRFLKSLLETLFEFIKNYMEEFIGIYIEFM